MKPATATTLFALLLASLGASGCQPGGEEPEPPLPPGLRDADGIRGVVTHGDGFTPARGVRVEAHCGCGVGYSATSNHAGEFSWPSVVDGSYTLEASLGLFHGEAWVSVVEGNSQAVSLQLGVDSVRLGTLGGGADDVAGMLSSLGYASTPLTVSDLGNALTYTSLAMLFIGSGADLAPSEDSAARQELQDFVDAGGYLYVSDRAHPYLTRIWPDRIRFLAEPEIGQVQQVWATAVDLELWDYLQGDEAEIMFDRAEWSVLDSQSSSTKILLQGDVATSSGVRHDVPLAVQRPTGGGRLVYSSFHKYGQINADMRRVLAHMLMLGSF